MEFTDIDGNVHQVKNNAWILEKRIVTSLATTDKSKWMEYTIYRVVYTKDFMSKNTFRNITELEYNRLKALLVNGKERL